MTFRRAIPRCTPEQQRRQDAIRAAGCLCCKTSVDRRLCGPTEIHHLTVSGRQIGQDATIALGQWHHRGIVAEGYTSSQMAQMIGPSLAKGSKPFHAHFGSNDALLAQQNRLFGVRHESARICA